MVEKLPDSITNNYINATGLLTALVCTGVFYIYKIPMTTASLAVLLICYAVPIALLEWIVLRVYRYPSTGLLWRQKLRPLSYRRIIIKITGLAGTLTTVAFLYRMFPEYSNNYYDSYWPFVKQLLGCIIVSAPFYIAFIDQRLENPEDELWQAGLFFTGTWTEVDWKKLREHALNWLIKAYFLPLMMISLFSNMVLLVGWNKGFDHFLLIYDFLWNSLYTVDLLVVTCGYILSLRLHDSHIRTPNPYAAAWAVALVCYKPFSNLRFSSYLPYGSEEAWKGWFSCETIFQVLWGTCILILTAMYSYTSLNFGLRFSNLTHRGIITNGAYRYSKHPAYITKNLSWWLAAMPFVGTGTGFDIFRTCIMLMLVNVIYYLRAKTEEKHLSTDPVYVQYALYMNEKALLAPLGRLLPFLQYKPPPQLAR
ncbi:MAG: isoprenylcysteine carboxyl methyltransferase [Proteobacteria bacterium]|nr:isoprenylcysteine carboxyl methyltransferase [Pseudomonadota bacterium]